MRLISLVRKIDEEENHEMHYVVGYNDYVDRAYMTRWYENREALLSESNALLRRDVKDIWYNPQVNTMCIEVR